VTSVEPKGARSTLEQAKPQPSTLKYLTTPLPKALQFNVFAFTIHVYVVYMGWEIEGHCFEFWSLGAVLDMW